MQGQARAHRIGQRRPVSVFRLITNDTYELRLFERACLKLSLEHALLPGQFGVRDTAGGDEGEARAGAGAAGGTDCAGGAGNTGGERVGAPGGGPLPPLGGGGGGRSLSRSELEELLRYGAYGILRDDGGEASRSFCEADIELILEQAVEVEYRPGGAHAKAASGAAGVGGEASGAGGSVQARVRGGGGCFSRASFVPSSAGSPYSDLSLDDPDFWAKMKLIQQAAGAAAGIAAAGGEAGRAQGAERSTGAEEGRGAGRGGAAGCNAGGDRRVISTAGRTAAPAVAPLGASLHTAERAPSPRPKGTTGRAASPQGDCRPATTAPAAPSVRPGLGGGIPPAGNLKRRRSAPPPSHCQAPVSGSPAVALTVSPAASAAAPAAAPPAAAGAPAAAPTASKAVASGGASGGMQSRLSLKARHTPPRVPVPAESLAASSAQVHTAAVNSPLAVHAPIGAVNSAIAVHAPLAAVPTPLAAAHSPAAVHSPLAPQPGCPAPAQVVAEADAVAQPLARNAAQPVAPHALTGAPPPAAAPTPDGMGTAGRSDVFPNAPAPDAFLFLSQQEPRPRARPAKRPRADGAGGGRATATSPPARPARLARGCGMETVAPRGGGWGTGAVGVDGTPAPHAARAAAAAPQSPPAPALPPARAPALPPALAPAPPPAAAPPPPRAAAPAWLAPPTPPAAPTPLLDLWHLLPDGRVSGRVFGKPNVKDGSKICTAPLRPLPGGAQPSPGMTVTTATHSRYALGERDHTAEEEGGHG